MKPTNGVYAFDEELPIRKGQVTPTELSAAVRDLADLLAEIASRRLQVASSSRPQEKISE